jgi:isoaspartyl peptidase/L-asparaginase-like protein (Ntn-hydrolase superfamily)
MAGIVVASANGSVGIEASIEVLRAGGSAVDAIVAGIALVEANPDDHSVGYSGLPNLLGEVELDASIMEGAGLRAGSVGALHGYQDAIALAKQVMDTLPHVLVVGAGADRLASEVGLPAVDLLTPEATAIWKQRFTDFGTGEPGTREAYYTRIADIVGTAMSDPQKVEDLHGTVNFIARDDQGTIACGVSTSGWAWKYPGRLGDSPIIGAGNYADNRWGAAACTGRGEMAQRCCTSHSVVTFMRFGMSVEESLKQAMIDLRSLDDPYRSEMNIIALDRDGKPAAASSAVDKTYIYMTTEMNAYVEEGRIPVPYEGY